MKQTNLRDSSLADSLEIVLEPRVMFDGAAVATAAQAADQVNHQAADADGDNHEAALQADGDAPSVSATGTTTGKVTVDKDGNTSGEVDVFENVQVSGDNLDHLTLEVDAAGSGHVLNIGGKDVALKAGTQVQLGDDFNSNICTVTLTDSGKYTVKVDVLDLSANQIQNLIDGIKYKATDGKSIADGQVVLVKIVGISQNDNDDGLMDKSINSEISIESQYNHDPVVEISNGLNIAGQVGVEGSDVAYSKDGNVAWVLGEDGKVTVLSLDGNKLTKIKDFALDDLGVDQGVTRIEITPNGEKGYFLTDGKIYQIDLNSSEVQSISISLDGNIDIAISANGKYLYATGAYGKYCVFDLTKNLNSPIASGDLSTNNNLFVTSSGDYVIMASGGGSFLESAKVFVFQQNNDGTLSQLGSVETNVSAIFRGDPVKVEVSSDGKNIVFWGNDTLVSLFVSNNGTTITSNQAGDLSDVKDLIYSDDGNTLYVLTKDDNGSSKVISYQVKDGILSNEKVLIENNNGSEKLFIDSLGHFVLTGNNTLLYSSELIGTFGQNVSFGSIVDFSDPESDLKDNFGNSQLVVDIAGGSGSFSFNLEGYTAKDGKIYFGGKLVAEYEATLNQLSIHFSDGCTKEQALKAVQGWNFAAASSTDGKVTITVTFTDDAGKSSSADIEAAFNQNTPPSATNTGEDISLNIANKDLAIFGGISLSTGEAGQKFTQVQISVSGLNDVDSTEVLTVDGTPISLSQSGTGKTTSGFSWSYTLIEGKGTLILKSAEGISLESTQNILNSINYKTGAVAGSTVHGLTGDRIFAVTGLTDNGGTEQGGNDTSIIKDVSTKVTLILNSSPALDTTGADHSYDVYLPEGVEQQINDLLPTYTDEWNSTYTNITAITSSSDGALVFVASNDGDSGKGNGSLFIFSRDSTSGKLSLVKSFSLSEIDNFHDSTQQNISNIIVSGSHVYISVTDSNSEKAKTAIVQYELKDDGTIDQIGVVAETGKNGVSGMSSTIRDVEVSSDGNYLFLTDGAGINKFKINADGSLDLSSTYSENGITNATTLSVSKDGNHIYVTNSDKSIAILNSSDLSLVTLVTKDSIGDQMPSDLPLGMLYGSEISPDGKYLYVIGGTDSYGTLTHVSSFEILNSGELKFLQSVELADSGFNTNSGGSMHMSADGKYLYVYGIVGPDTTMAVVGLDGLGGVQYKSQFVTAERGDVFTVLSDGTLLMGSVGFGHGLSEATPAPSVDTVGGKVKPALGMVVSDVDSDAKNSYDGFNLTIERDGGADSSDKFSLQGTDISVDKDGKVSYKGTIIGTLTLGDGTASVSFSGDVSKEAVNAVLNAITYQVPDKATDAIKLKITVNDGVKLNSDEDSGYFEDSAVVAVIPQSVAIEPDHQTLPYDNQGTNAFANVEIQFTADAEKLIGGSSLIVTPSDATAQFGVSGDYTLSDGNITDKHGTTIATLKTGENGSVTLTLDKSVTKDQINGLVKAITYQTGNSDPQGNVTFGLELKSSEGKTLDSCSVASTIDFGENHPPVVDQTVAGKWNPEVKPGDSVNLSIPDGLITDVDEKDKSLTWSVDGAPQGWTIEMVNGKPVIKGDVSADFRGATITLKATDSAGASASVEIYISAEGVENTPPVWDADTAAAVSNSYSAGKDIGSIDLSKHCSDNEGQKITYSVDENTLPPGLSFKDGVLSGKVTTKGAYSFTVTATDASGKTADFTFNVQVTNEAPVFGGKDTSWTVSANKDNAFEHDFSSEFTDKEVSVDKTQELSLTVEFTEPKLDKESYKFQNGKLTLNGVQPGTYHFTITADDGFGGTLAQEFTVRVENSQPKFTGNADLGSVTTDDTNIALDVKGQFTDTDKDQKLTLEVSKEDQAKLNDLGLTFDAATGTVKALDGSPTKAGTVEFTVSVTDGFSDPVTQKFTVEVRENQQPSLDPGWVPGENATVQGNTVNVTIKTPFTADISDAFKDPDAADAGNVTIEVKDADSLPSWLHYDAATKTFSGTPETLGAVSVTVVVSDGHGDPIEHTLVFNVDNPSFTVPVSQFRHAPLYDPTAAHELEEDLLMPVAPTSDLPDASIDLAGSSTPFATSQGLSMAMAALQASEPGSKGLSGAALLSAAQVAHSVQHGDVAQPLHGMDQTGKAAAVRAGSSMTLPTQGDKGTPVDEFLWQGSNVIQDGTPTSDGAPVAPSTAVPAQVSMAGKPALTEQVHERSAYGDEAPSAKA